MKTFLLPVVISLAVAIPACGRQAAERMDHALLELKAEQAESKRMAEQITSLTTGQEKLREELAATRAALDEVKTRAAADLAAALAKADEQQKKSGQQLDELRKVIADVKASVTKSAETAAAQPAKPKAETSATPGGEKPAIPNGPGTTSKTVGKPSGRTPIKIDFDGAGAAKTNPAPSKADLPPTKRPQPSNGVRNGSAKIFSTTVRAPDPKELNTPAIEPKGPASSSGSLPGTKVK